MRTVEIVRNLSDDGEGVRFGSIKTNLSDNELKGYFWDYIREQDDEGYEGSFIDWLIEAGMGKADNSITTVFVGD